MILYFVFDTNFTFFWIMKRKRTEKEEKVDKNDQDDYYTVEKILDMKEQNGKRYYLVKWLNWDVKTCTWE